MTKKINRRVYCAFSLTEVLVALLVVTITLGALAPVFTKKVTQGTMTSSASKQGGSTPVGGIILWSISANLPDDTWLSCDGQLIPNDSKYDKLRGIYGTNIPNLNGYQSEVNDNISNYIKEDLKKYIDEKNAELAIGKTFPKNIIGIWGTTDAIPDGWEEATEFQGVFLRGYGSTTFTQNNGSAIGNTSTTHTSGNLGEIQGDAVRNVYGEFRDRGFDTSKDYSGVFSIGTGSLQRTVHGSGTSSTQGFSFDASRVVPTAEENRPVNKAVKYIKCSGGPSYTSSPEELIQPPAFTQRFRYIIKTRL